MRDPDRAVRGATRRSRRLDLRSLLLGPPLRTSEELRERLTNPRALAVLASDALSSVAYATEQMLRVLVPVSAAAAYVLVAPLSGVVVAVLGVLILSYRQTIRSYPNAGGAYVVSRDNFGLGVAQLAGASLLVDYVLTVAVSASAGVSALYSASPALFGLRVPMTVALVWFIAWVNLRGLRASGRVFAAPTYLFVASIGAMVVVGLVRGVGATRSPTTGAAAAATEVGTIVLLHAFASGCTAMTGVEAISNGVSVFRPVEWRNAQKVLTWLGVLLGATFIGIAVLAWRLRPAISPRSTVLSELATEVFGRSGIGNVGYLAVQASTAVILALAANTSFADFPRLASFEARDHYLPPSLGRRGRRLVLSGGMVALAVASTVLIVATSADVSRLIPLYAIGVFTSFTLSQSGMVRHHWRHREKAWRRGALVNGTGAVTSFAVLVVIAVSKFSQGAWIALLLIPILVGLLQAVRSRRRRIDDLLRSREWQTGHLDPSGVVALVVVTPQAPSPAVEECLSFARRVPGALRIVALGRRAASRPDLPDHPIGIATSWRAVAARVADLGSRSSLTVVVIPVDANRPEGRPFSPARRALRALTRIPRTAIALVPYGGDAADAPGATGTDDEVIVLVGVPHARGLDVVTVARSLGRPRATVLHVVDEEEPGFAGSWADLGADTPFEEVVAPHRDPVEPILAAVSRSAGAASRAVVATGMLVDRWSTPIQDHRARRIRRALLAQGVTVTVVPHHLGIRPGARARGGRRRRRTGAAQRAEGATGGPPAAARAAPASTSTNSIA